MKLFTFTLLLVVICAGCGLLTSGLPTIVEDLREGGYTGLNCDETKLINPIAAGCDADEIAVECTAQAQDGTSTVFTVCSEIIIEKDE